MIGFGRMAYAGSLFKTLTARKLLNLIKIEVGYLLSKIMRKPVMFGLPWAASIEPTNLCNLRCTQCPTGMHTLSRKQGNLPIENFRNLINKLSDHLIHLTLYFQGEPFLHPQFIEMVRIARENRLFVSTSTNGHFLDEKTAQKVVESKLNHLIISADGLDQETYETYRVNGNLQKVLDGITNLVAAKKKARSKLPFIELQFLVMGHNEHQVNEMRNLAKNLEVDRLTFKSAQVYDFGNGNILIPQLDKKSRYRKTEDGNWVLKKKLKNQCHRLWRSLVITWEGNVVPCCYDKDAENGAGNLLEISLKEIWHSVTMKSFRNKVVSNRKAVYICSNCGE